jgi:hypothetical protein
MGRPAWGSQGAIRSKLEHHPAPADTSPASPFSGQDAYCYPWTAFDELALQSAPSAVAPFFASYAPTLGVGRECLAAK